MIIGPHMAAPLDLDDEMTQAAVRAGLEHGRILLLFALMDRKELPLLDQIHHIGVIAQVQSMQRGNGVVIVVQGILRTEVREFVQTKPYIRALCHSRPDPEVWDEETDQLMLEVRGLIEAFVELTPGLPEGVINFVRSIRTPGHLADNSAYAPEYTYDQRLELLNAYDVKKRLMLVRDFFRQRVAYAQVQSQVREQAKAGLESSQREYILREQLKAIREEFSFCVNHSPTPIPLGSARPSTAGTSPARSTISAPCEDFSACTSARVDATTVVPLPPLTDQQTII
jgi:ATP-dependent Lon protease